MRIEDPRVEELDGSVRRSVRMSWIGGERRVAVEVPAEYAPPDDDDCSAFVPVALMAAMRRAEPLQVDGRVSRQLVEALPRAQEMISSWNPTLARVAVRVVGPAGVPNRAGGRACCISRGVDSTYSGATERDQDDRLTALVFWRNFELRYSEATRAREAELAGELSGRLGLPLVVARSDAPELLVDVIDFNDATSAMLASVALSLPGLAGRFALPSTLDYAELTPNGTHPLLDGLWSTEAVQIEHESCLWDRHRKVRWLVHNRPDLLPSLHVCTTTDSNANCGRCGKCLATMLMLYVEGALEQATSFPSTIDPELVRRAKRPALHHLKQWDRLYRLLPPGENNDALRKALRGSMQATTRRPPPSTALSMIAQNRRSLHNLMRGRPTDSRLEVAGAASAEFGPLQPGWPPPRGLPSGRLGLVRAVDGDARRHRYAAGELPLGQRSGELGALLAEPPPQGVPLHLDAEGAPVLPERAARPSARTVGSWIFAPLAWRDRAPAAARLRSTARRVLDGGRALVRPRPRHERGPAGWLHAEDGLGRSALWAARHAVIDDVLLTTDPREAAELGYGEPVALGFLEDHAPVTGVSGPAAVRIPWARHWGRL